MVTTQELGRFGLFAGLSEAQLDRILALAEEKHCHAGESLFREGDPATHLYLLLKGKVAIQVQLTSRPETITTTVLSQPGQLIGWSGLVPPHHYTAAGVCQADSHLLMIEGEALRQAMERDPEMGFLLMQQIAGVISGRLRTVQQVVLKTL